MSHQTPGYKDQSSKIEDYIVAVLLAAGRSRRMGEFKPLLPFGPTTVVKHCISNLREAGIEEIIVVAGHREKDIQSHLAQANLIFALNPDPDSEMSASIAAGVKKVGPAAKAVLITLVDHPAVPPSVIKQLIDEWRRRDTRLVQPEYDGRGGHPVLIDLVYRADLMNLDPQRGLRSFLDSHRPEVRRIEADSPYVARDMDTWEDYLRLHQDIFGWLPCPDG
jgi:molybdenum cofactor cytidylyltransferase